MDGEGVSAERQSRRRLGDWVNGGVWSTQDARAMMAYYRTGRSSR